jgi:hypothetical protein
MTPDLGVTEGIHHPLFGKILKQRMEAVGSECTLRLREDFPELSKEAFREKLHKEGVAFLRRVLKVEQAAATH